jgi:hypothetical protein
MVRLIPSLISVLVPLLVVLALVIWGCWWLINRLAQRRFQYSLRTLLIGVTVVAVVLSAYTAWNRWTRAQLEFLDADAPAFAFLKMTPEISEATGPSGFKVTYRPRYRGIGEVERISDEARTPRGTWHGRTTDFMKQTAVLESGERHDLEAGIVAMQKADVLLPGRFVIHGVLKDAAGDPIPDAQVNLDSANSFNVMFRTLDDGTFFIPIKPPIDPQYSFEIYYGGKKMVSTTFSLDPATPEMFVTVRVR